MYRALEKHYPTSHEVLEDIGMTLRRVEKNDEALAYLEKAVDLAPEDPIDNRSLADAYVALGDDDGAEVHLRKSISVQTDEALRKAWTCDFGEFLEMRRRDRLSGCEIERANCPSERWTACAPRLPDPDLACTSASSR